MEQGQRLTFLLLAGFLLTLVVVPTARANPDTLYVDGADKFPGGSTPTVLEKLHATEVPEFLPVDLTPLVEAETELA